jgi:cytochrome P450
VRAIVDRSIERELAAMAGGDTTLARLVAVHRKSPESLPKREIRSVLIGMITGFVPTNTMAGGHILEMLLDRPEMLKRAQQAAETGDDDRLMRCLFEALRFADQSRTLPYLWENYRIAADTPHAAAMQEPKVLAMTSSAMFDSRRVLRPFKFDPGRPASNYMHFGFGMHWCAAR